MGFSVGDWVLVKRTFGTDQLGVVTSMCDVLCKARVRVYREGSSFGLALPYTESKVVPYEDLRCVQGIFELIESKVKT